MHYAGLVLAVAGLAAAQTTTTTAGASTNTAASGCGAQVDQIISTCLGTEQAQMQSCAQNDWNCLCSASTNVLTCYNNCPSDPNAFTAQQQQTSYCNAAKQFGSSSSLATTASVNPSLSSALASKSATTTGSSSAAAATASGSSTASSSASSASASHSSSADPALQISGWAALFGLAALL